jgi:hypothetical protein
MTKMPSFATAFFIGARRGRAIKHRAVANIGEGSRLL